MDLTGVDPDQFALSVETIRFLTLETPCSHGVDNREFQGAVEDLLKPENKDKLTQILTYHVIPGKVMSADVMGAVTNAVSVQGEELTVDGTDGVTVNGATVTRADIDTSNGVIHVIEAVILPPSGS